MNASSAPASQLTSTPSVITAKNDRIRPNAMASPGVMRPRGIGRLAVRATRRLFAFSILYLFALFATLLLEVVVRAVVPAIRAVAPVIG